MSIGLIANRVAIRWSRAANVPIRSCRLRVGCPARIPANGEAESISALVSSRSSSSWSGCMRWASSIFPAVRAVSDVLTWAFTLRACLRREAGGDASRGGCGGAWLALAGWGAFGELGFELGDAPVGEPVVGAGGFEPVFQGPVVVAELADALLERGVLGGQPLRGLRRQVVFQVADLAEEDGHAAPLGGDLGLGCLQRRLGVERAFPPGWLLIVAAPGVLGAGLADGVADQRLGVGVGVEEGA